MGSNGQQYVVGGLGTAYQQLNNGGYSTNERSISSGTGQTAQSTRPKTSFGSENYSYQQYQPNGHN